MDLEAVEMGFRAALHQAGATALTQLLQFPKPPAEQSRISCSCGQQARYRELRSRPLLTVLGEVELRRPWYLCSASTTFPCHDNYFSLLTTTNLCPIQL